MVSKFVKTIMLITLLNIFSCQQLDYSHNSIGSSNEEQQRKQIQYQWTQQKQFKQNIPSISEPKVTISEPKVTISQPKVTISQPKVAIIDKNSQIIAKLPINQQQKIPQAKKYNKQLTNVQVKALKQVKPTIQNKNEQKSSQGQWNAKAMNRDPLQRQKKYAALRIINNQTIKKINIKQNNQNLKTND